MRAFVCVEGPSIIPLLARAPSGAPLHLTLAFLGEVADERADALVATVATAVRDHPPFTSTLADAGAYPSPARPRIVYLGVGNGAAELTALARSVRAGLGTAGFAFDERPFVPHLTVLRVRGAADAARARALLGAAAPPTPFRVEAVLVKSSRLDRGGAEHVTIGRGELRGPTDAPTGTVG